MTQFLRKTLTAAAITAAIVAGSPVFAQDKPAATPAHPGAAAAAAAPGAAAKPAAPPVDTKAIDAKFKSEKEKYGYMVGMDVARSIGQIKDEVDTAAVIQALQASLKGEKTTLTDAEAVAVRQEFMQKLQGRQVAKMKDEADKNQKEGDAFLAKNKDKPGVKVTASGLQYEVVKQGTGPKPKATDVVKVDYTGTKIDGTKFDSSVDRGQPATFPLNQVVPGWTEGLQLMPVGSEYKFYIPGKLAYGERGPAQIGPNATLIFSVKLIGIEPPAADAKADAPKIVPPAEKH
ncbi:MAG TPA: FKBP-type peptidyl-prolyl cis-trans isomerase [Rhodanobacteraceae bacterium]|nr:FKBP-type peptidyl-prolyl cis-trans isomerase [Rhodanobacteraceae bacterium]